MSRTLTPREAAAFTQHDSIGGTWGGSALMKLGAESVLQSSTAVSRAVDKQKQCRVFRLPPEGASEIGMEAAGRPTGLHAPRSSVSYAPNGRPIKGSQPLSAREPPAWQSKIISLQPEMQPYAVRRLAEGNFFCGPDPMSAREGFSVPMPFNGGVHLHSPVDDETLQYLRRFASRARRGGPRSIMRVIDAFRTVATSKNGCLPSLDLQAFSEVALAQSLCSTQRQCANVYTHFTGPNAPPRSVVDVEAVASTILGEMNEVRAQAVQDIWRQYLDPEGVGFVHADVLLDAFDPRRLPVMCLQARTMEEIRLELVESLGIDSPAPHPTPGAILTNAGTGFDDFAMDEAVSRRRPPLIGTHGRPVRAPAGQPTAQRASWRPRGDIAHEVAAHGPAVKMDMQVSHAAFEGYYAAISVTMPDEELFLRVLRAPWTWREVHEAAEGMRHGYKILAKGDPGSKFKILAQFEGGSQKVVVLLDDTNLGAATGSAGADNGQIWTWGKHVHAEIIRRLEKQGINGIESIVLRPS